MTDSVFKHWEQTGVVVPLQAVQRLLSQREVLIMLRNSILKHQSGGLVIIIVQIAPQAPNLDHLKPRAYTFDFDHRGQAGFPPWTPY